MENTYKKELREQNNLNKKPTKKSKIFKVVKNLVMAAVVAFSIGSKVSVNNLPTSNQVDRAYELMNIDSSYTYGKPFSNVKFNNSQTININVNIDNLTDEEKQVFKDCVDEMQEICSLINKDYHFQLNYKTSGLEFEKIFNSINISSIPLSELRIRENSDSAIASTIYKDFKITNSGLCVVNANVYLPNEIFNFSNNKNNQVINTLDSLIRHEVFGHDILGLSDAYLIDNYNKESIMNENRYYSLNDIKLAIARLSKDPLKIDVNEVYRHTILGKKLSNIFTADKLNHCLYRLGYIEENDNTFDEFDDVKMTKLNNYNIISCYKFKQGQLSYKTVNYNKDGINHEHISEQFEVINLGDNVMFSNGELYVKKGQKVFKFYIKSNYQFVFNSEYDVLTEDEYQRFVKLKNLNEAKNFVSDCVEQRNLTEETNLTL